MRRGACRSSAASGDRSAGAMTTTAVRKISRSALTRSSSRRPSRSHSACVGEQHVRAALAAQRERLAAPEASIASCPAASSASPIRRRGPARAVGEHDAHVSHATRAGAIATLGCSPQTGGGSACGRSGRDAARVVDVALHLLDELLDRVEAQLAAQAREERQPQLAAVEVAVEPEQERLDEQPAARSRTSGARRRSWPPATSATPRRARPRRGRRRRRGPGTPAPARGRGSRSGSRACARACRRARPGRAAGTASRGRRRRARRRRRRSARGCATRR